MVMKLSLYLAAAGFELLFVKYAHHAFMAISREQTHRQRGDGAWVETVPCGRLCCISSKLYGGYLSLECACNWWWRDRNEQNMRDFYGFNVFLNVALFHCGAAVSCSFFAFPLAYRLNEAKKSWRAFIERNQTSKPNESVDGWLLSKCTHKRQSARRAFRME